MPTAASAEPVDTVLLKNGGRLRGVVEIYDPVKGVTITLVDGETRHLDSAEVASVDYGSSVDEEAGEGIDAEEPVASANSGAATPKQRLGKNFWISGICIFSATHVATLVLTAVIAQDDPAASVAHVAAPFAGPWILLAVEDADGGQVGALVASGVLQAGAAGLFVAGVVLANTGDAPSALVVPSVGRGFGGLTLAGSFW